jgi:hypothetical protein
MYELLLVYYLLIGSLVRYQISLARISKGKQYILITPNNIDHVLAEPPVVRINRMDDPRN